MTDRLSPASRTRWLARMESEVVDVLVVGGGITGAGIALDAATRGLSTALVETQDWASGTSSRSSKLIHGGLRYLEMLDFGLVHEALRERGLLLNRLAPHLVRPVPFLYPLRHRVWERMYVGAGIAAYDALAIASGAKGGIPTHRHLSKRAALRAAPALRPEALHGAIQYWDAAVDDARYTMSVVRTAAAYGALAASRVRLTEYIRDGDKVTGARLHDLTGDRSFTLHARQVINATGVWSSSLQRLAGIEEAVQVRASKGVHLVVAGDRIDSSTGIVARSDHSVLFVIPWGQHWIVGTTDTEWPDASHSPVAGPEDIDYLLAQVNRWLRRPLERSDVLATYAGLRPLVARAAGTTAGLSREHVVARAMPGLVVIAGGKYTTYRVMAAHAVDEAVSELNGDGAASCTDEIPLVGAAGYVALWNQRSRMAEESGLAPAVIERLLRRYGDRINDLRAIIADQPELSKPLAAAPAYLGVEVVYAVSHEGAQHLEDVLVRRTRIAMETRGHGGDAAAEVAALMAPVLGWDKSQIDSEIAAYSDLVSTELEALGDVVSGQALA